MVMTTRNTPVMDGLVDFVLGLELAAVPLPVVEAAGRSMTDWLGTAIRGSIEPLADAAARVITAAGGEPQATIVGRGQRTSALLASLANGAQGHALDFDTRTCRPCSTGPLPSRQSSSRSRSGGMPGAPRRSPRSSPASRSRRASAGCSASD
jgi:hypothetical protein